MICANLCSQTKAQQKRHAENEAKLNKELAKERGILKKAWVDTVDCVGMLDEPSTDDSVAPPTMLDLTTALLAHYRKQLSR